MDFYNILENENGNAVNPFAYKDKKGEYHESTVSVDYLNSHFGEYSTATEMKNATESEGLSLYFDWLVEQGKLPV